MGEQGLEPLLHELATVDVPPAAPAPPQAWRTFEHVPRFHNNYVGMRNRFAILTEAYAYATFKDRILATNYIIEEAMNYASVNAAKIKKACADADKEAVVATPLAAAEIYLHGAHVTHFQPTGQKSVLFMSGASKFEPGKAIRGGGAEAELKFSGSAVLVIGPHAEDGWPRAAPNAAS